MAELVSASLRPVLRALLIWTPLLLGSVVLAGLVLAGLAGRRFRGLAAAGGGDLRARRWAVRLLLIATQAFLLPLCTLATAVPFALQLGVADAIESASPRILDWGLRTGTRAMGNGLSIADSATVVDLDRLAPVLRTVRPAAARGRWWLKPLSVVPGAATSAWYRALDRAMEQAAAANLRVT